jgi:hypothetical protein
MKTVWLACICIVMSAGLQRSASSNSWDGTWKLNEARSRLAGPSFAITSLPKGGYQVNTGTYSFRFFCDAKDYPTVGASTIACVRVDPTTMDTVLKENGRLVNTTHRELSGDGKTLTQTAIVVHSNGSRETDTKVFARVTASTGFAGVWKDKDALGREPKLIITNLEGGTFRLAFPAQKQYTDMKLDGSEAITHGVSSGAQFTMSVRTEGPLKLLTVQKLKGTIVNLGALMLSPDGRTLVEESWRPQSPQTKTMLVYEKQ